MELWSYGVMELWSYGVMELWSYGVMELWSYGHEFHEFSRKTPEFLVLKLPLL